MRTIAVVQARLGSTRFPRKVLADLGGYPLVLHVLIRAMRIQGLHHVVLAVPFPDLLEMTHALEMCSVGSVRSVGEDTARTRRVTVVIGSEEGCPDDDVLGRFLATARQHEADVIMRVTADCPALNPVVAGKVLELFHASQPCDFASNDTLISGYPDGWDVEVFSRAALETAAAQATDPIDREHVTPWMKRSENGMRCVTLMAPEPWTGPKLSVDTPSDLETVREWMAHHG